MSTFGEEIEALAVKLFKCEAIKFGDFKMKSGSNSPIYFDLRIIISYPELLDTVADLLLRAAENNLKCDSICGVPYTALPIATILSVKTKIPMLIRRKEAKSYGTKKLIEGKFKENDTCIIVEDVVTSGSSILETVKDLRAEKIMVNKAILILDREQGGLQNLKNKGIEVVSLLTMSKMIKILVKNNLLSPETVTKVEEYLKNSTVSLPENLLCDVDKTKISFEERLKLAVNPVAKTLFKIMSEKESNLCLAADLSTCHEILEIFKATGPYICMFKLHIDIIQDFTESFIKELQSLAKQYNVMLMEDRKYGDIGNTVALQHSGGLYKVNEWAHTVTAHVLPGPGVLKGLSSVFHTTNDVKGIFIVAEMSSEGALTSPQYIDSAIKLAKQYEDVVAGVVCQSKGVCTSPGLIQLTPGVQLNNSNDNLGQQYNTPEHVMLDNDADVVVVGRGIIKSKNSAEEAKIYQTKLWECYQRRLTK